MVLATLVFADSLSSGSYMLQLATNLQWSYYAVFIMTHFGKFDSAFEIVNQVRDQTQHV